MTDSQASTSRAGTPRRRRISGPAMALGAVIGWSAFLLFSVEPLIGRLVLPVFGGAPAVWATALFFFQAVLLLGYLYGHLSVTRLGIRRGPAVHVALVAAAAVALAMAPSRVADLGNPALPDVANLLVMLTFTIGLPAFVLTTTTPLVSGWFAATRTRDAGDGDAYWLYALSNAGSLLALLAYPFGWEPRLALSAQRGVWAVGFVLFGIGIAACAAWARRHAAIEAPADERGASSVDPIGWRRRLTWLLLAAVPSGLLSAVTTFIATDLVSAPLLWLVPLAIYLLSFIVAFSARGRRLVPAALLAAPAAVTLMWVPYGSAGGWPILPLVLLMYGGLGVVATALHGRLALDRPEPARLTEFYLVISVGGALASGFVALVAPVVFAGIWELPMLLVLALVALAASRFEADVPSLGTRRRLPLDLSPFVRGARWRLGPYTIVAVVLAGLLLRDASLGAEAGVRWLLVGGLVLAVGARPGFLAVSSGLVLALAVLVLQPAVVFRDRSFFGVTEVLRPAGAEQTTLMNGTTVHGVQSTDPADARKPTAYYSEFGPFGDLFRAVQSGPTQPAIGVVGLGAGALTAYVRPGWSMTYFEIDPVVSEVASDSRFFTYLSGSDVQPRIVLGDARLSLQSVPSDSFDVLVMDAFSSDAVPTHLLTAEALAMFRRVVGPDGLVAVHISNRYYDLAPAVAGAARASGLKAMIRAYQPDPVTDKGGWPTILVVATETGSLEPFRSAGWIALEPTVPPMTDDFMDVLRFLRPLW